MVTRINWMQLVLVQVLVVAGMQRDVSAQAREPDAAAAAAFERMVDAYRVRPGLTVRTTVSVATLEGNIEAQSDELTAEFTFGRGRAAVIKLRGFMVYLHDGRFTAVHEGTEGSYFSAPDEGSPYYALLTAFMDIPFPHLSIHLGEEAMEDLWMQFHPRAPWLRPTGVRDEVREDGAVQILTLSSDFETMDLTLDPESKLMQSAQLRITGGHLVQEGTTLIYEYTFDYDEHDEPLQAETFTFDPGDRLRVDQLGALLPRQPIVARPPEQRQGVVGGGIIGQPAPAFDLELLSGERIALKDLQGHVVILDFWATWCRPCLRGLPILHELDQWAREQQLPVRVITVNTFEIPDPDQNTLEKRRKQARAFWENHGFSLPVAMDHDDSIAVAYGVRGIPTTVVIRADGIVHMLHIGVEGDLLEQLKQNVTDAIKALEL